MTRALVITGTDTDIGKTVVAAMLTLALDASYWKPIQSGTDGGTDRHRVQELTGLPNERFLPEQYVLRNPLSPHRAAEIDSVEIERFDIPTTDSPLIIEGAGGLMVPLTRQKLQIDLFAEWGAPVVLCARTGLGTINHTLLSIEALRRRNINLHGLIFIGADNADNIKTIANFSGCPVLGRMPVLDVIDRTALVNAFAQNFRKEDFV